MAKALGVGGVFFKAKDPETLYQWYQQCLGISKGEEDGVTFPPASDYVVWSIFKPDTQYFSPSPKEYMFNLVVDDLDGALKQVSECGGEQVGEIESYDNGRFAWFLDPEGNKVELWQPSGK